MYKYIVKAIYISQSVDRKKFNEILKGTTWEIYIDPSLEAEVNKNNEFVRILCEDSYMDFAIKKIIFNQFFTIKLGKLIDTNKTTRDEKH